MLKYLGVQAIVGKRRLGITSHYRLAAPTPYPARLPYTANETIFRGIGDRTDPAKHNTILCDG